MPWHGSRGHTMGRAAIDRSPLPTHSHRFASTPSLVVGFVISTPPPPPVCRHTISLYANISSIRWDFNSSLVKGFITSAEGAGIKAFEMDPAHTSSMEMTNRLWDMMDSK
jgi:hypothetical protein